MLRKRIAIPVLSSCLCISMLPLQAFAAPSPIWNTTSTESPADTNTFQWDDDTKDDALTVFVQRLVRVSRQIDLQGDGKFFCKSRRII